MELKEQQPPMSIDEQIDNLKALGLQIEDEEYARAILNDISYFRLIKAYSLGLKQRNSAYNSGVTFERIVSLYTFNAKFRQLLFPKIEQIEVTLRCRLANYFSCEYGVLGYKLAENFSADFYHDEFMQEIRREISCRQKSPFVKNFQRNYIDGEIPFYALVELFSFGTLSKFYKNMKSPDKKAVASTYGVGYTYLESWIEHISCVRNICAHYERLYNAKITKRPSLYRQYSEQGIGNERVFATLICMKHLLPDDRHWTEFLDTIELLFEKFSDVRPDRMDFPNNWKEILEQD